MKHAFGGQNKRMATALKQQRENDAKDFVNDMDKFLETNGLVIGSTESEMAFAMFMFKRGWKK